MVARHKQAGRNHRIVWLTLCLAKIETRLSWKNKGFVRIISYTIQIHVC